MRTTNVILEPQNVLSKKEFERHKTKTQTDEGGENGQNEIPQSEEFVIRRTMHSQWWDKGSAGTKTPKTAPAGIRYTT